MKWLFKVDCSGLSIVSFFRGVVVSLFGVFDFLLLFCFLTILTLLLNILIFFFCLFGENWPQFVSKNVWGVIFQYMGWLIGFFSSLGQKIDDKQNRLFVELKLLRRSFFEIFEIFQVGFFWDRRFSNGSQF